MVLTTEEYTIRLRPYQEQAIAAVLAARDHGVRRQLIVLPTGAGKTLIFAAVIRELALPALILAHRDELITQAADKVGMVAPDLSIGIVKAELNELGQQVTIASVQTLAQPHRLAQLPRDFGIVVVDEAHHAPATSYQMILDYLCAGCPDGPLLLGCTATADRLDGQGLDGTFSGIVFELDVLSLIEDGYLSDVRAKRVHYSADFSQLKVTAGDISEASAARVFREGGGPAAVATALREYAPTRKSLVFVPGVECAYETAATINQAGIPAAAIDGTTPLTERRGTLRRFHVGDLRALVNCGVLTEGYDEPSVDCVMLARPTKSRSLYAQMVGRGSRRFPGKEDLLVLDLAGNTSRHELVTPASLFGLDPEDIEEDEALTEAVSRKRQRIQREAAAQHATVMIEARVVDLFKRQRTRWVAASGGRYALSTGEGQFILDPEDLAADRWRAIEYRHGDGPRVLHRGLSLSYAMGIAEAHIDQRNARILNDPDASWLHDPPSPKQLAFMKRLRIVPPPDVTKGVARDLIAATLAGKVAV